MVTRIADIGVNNLFIQDILRNQNRVFEAQRQVSTGQKSQNFKGIGKDINQLISLKSQRERAEQYQQANQEIAIRLALYDTVINEIRDLTLELRDAYLTSVNTNSGIVLREQAEDLYDRLVALMQTKDNGRFIFSGSRTDTNPLTTAALTVAGLEGINADVSKTTGTATLVTQNNSNKASQTIEQNLSFEYGILAEDVSADLMEIFRDFFEDDTATPYGNNLTGAQVTFLTGQLSTLNSELQDIDQIHAENGFRQKTIEEVNTRHSDDITFLSIFISDIEEVDTAEAITRLNQDQVALEASLAVTAQLTRLTLLDFL